MRSDADFFALITLTMAAFHLIQACQFVCMTINITGISCT